MTSRTVIDGNAFYEIDEECLREKEEKEKQTTEQNRKKELKKGCHKADSKNTVALNNCKKR